MSQIELRCALAHELLHIKHGHTSCQPPAIERRICLETARYLVPFEDLAGVVGWSRCPSELADELGVTEQVVLDRLATLDGDQIQALWPASEHFT